MVKPLSPSLTLDHRRRRNSAEKEKPSSRRRTSWTPDQVERYFSGVTDAASHLAERVSNNYLNAGLPLSPLPPSKPPRLSVNSEDRYQTQRKRPSVTNPYFLGPQTPTEPSSMSLTEIRCNKCHRYMQGAPDPALAHEDSPGDARCTLFHHPSPCDYKSSKHGDCTLYPHLGARGKEVDTTLGDEVIAKKFEVLDALATKSNVMEGNLARVEGSIGKLASEMERVATMIGLLTKPNPSPSGSLSVPPLTDTGHAPLASGQQAQAAAVGLGQEQISDLANDLIASNQQKDNPSPQVPNYTGPTLPAMRKDQDLTDLVRSELSRLLSITPSLQKAPDANTSSNITKQPSLQESILAQQASARKQLLQFQESQQQQLEKFAADQKKQLEALQAQLGIVVPTAAIQKTQPPTPPSPSLQPPVCTPCSDDRNHPAYLALGGQRDQISDQAGAGALAMDMETLLGLTVRSKQFRPYEFAKRTQLFYASSITERNCNFPCYILGYLRHCLILMSGVVASSENEISSRLTNLMNICEIAANNSTLNDFDCPGWQIGKAYGDRVFHDMESGRRSWEELPAHILPDIFLHARDTVAMRSNKPKNKPEEKIKGKKKTDGSKACSTYNTFRTGEGCAYEWSNSDKKCEFDHYCKKCHQKSGKKERHKAINCEVETDPSKKDE